MVKKIKKRDGREADFKQEKITKAISKALAAADSNEDIAEEISNKVVAKLEAKIKDREKLLEVEEIQDSVVETLKESDFEDVAETYQTYREKRTQIREAKWWLLNHDVKTKLTKNALQVLESRYLQKNEQGKITETPQELFKRVATNIASAEKIYDPSLTDPDLIRIKSRFYKKMVSLEFLPNSPTLMNAGGALQQLSACFVLPVEDSMESIFDQIKNAALIHKSGGGTGFSFSRLRPKGDVVKSTGGIASGPLSFMTVFDAATNVVKQGGKRRGANMGVMRVDHPDILDFVTSKEEEGELSNFNISVAATNEFMDAVKEGEEYDLVNPRTKKPEGTMEARKVFNEIVDHAWKNGEPGMIYLDRINAQNPTPHVGDIESTNPCGEQPLLPYESCNLGSINLGKMVSGNGEDAEIDWDNLKDTVHTAVRFLDNVIDKNNYPLSDIEEMTKANRKIGLGVMGFANMLIRLRVPYGSDESLQIGAKVMKFIQDEGHKASQKLAQNRGAFPNFEGSIYDKKDTPPMRNSTVTTIAPTGTISIIGNTSGGIEPLFSIAFKRKHVLGNEEMIEVNDLFEEIAKERGFWSEDLKEKLPQKKSIQDVDEIPEDVKKYFQTALDVDPIDHVRMQAVFQKYTDNAVSKTINFPYSASKEKVKKAYISAYNLGCKGLTLYRNQSRKQQVLNIDDEEEGEAGGELKEEVNDDTPPMPGLPPSNCPTCNI